MSRFLDLTNQKFGRLTVLSLARIHRQAYWWCLCSCGTITEVAIGQLRSGKTKSCGCLAIERLQARITTHGKRHTRTYTIWCGMVQRCTDLKCPTYARYGGVGVKLCARWRVFENFLRDMGECPPEKSIDRYPDRQGDYEPGNCRWATCLEQAQNRKVKKDAKLITFEGKTQHIAAWAKEKEMPPARLELRLRRGWSISRALMTP